MASAGEIAFLLRRLIDLAEQEGEALKNEAWEDAVAVRSQFDPEFSKLEKLVGQSQLTPASANDLTRLNHLHERNQTLAKALQNKAGSALAEITKVSRIGNYAPLGGGDNPPSPRYLDHSA